MARDLATRLDVVRGVRDAGARRAHARQIFGRPARRRAQPAWEPPVDVLETEHEVLVLVALPGVDADSAQAVIEDGDLVIAGTRVLPPELQTAIIHRLELPQGRFYRRLRLPPGRYSGVRRAAADGCLLITLAESGSLVVADMSKCRPRKGLPSAAALPPLAVRRADHRAGAQHRAVSRHWCCRSRSAGRSRSPRPSRRCASSARSASCCSATPRSTIRAAIDLHRIGTVANILRYITAPDGTHHLICQGEQRFQVVEYLPRLAVPRGARACASPEPDAQSLGDRGALRRPARRQALEAIAAAAAGAGRAARRPCRRSTRRRRSPIWRSPTWT